MKTRKGLHVYVLHGAGTYIWWRFFFSLERAEMYLMRHGDNRHIVGERSASRARWRHIVVHHLHFQEKHPDGEERSMRGR